MAGLKRIYVTEQAYRMLARYCLERYGTLKGITRVASELLAEAISQKTSGLVDQETTGLVDQKSIGLVDQKTSGARAKDPSPSSAQASSPSSAEAPRPAAERKELKVEIPPPKIELPGKPEPPPVPPPAGGQAAKGSEGEAARGSESEAVEKAVEKRGPTPKQLALIESLLKRLGGDWSSVREILLLDKGIEAPEDYRQLSGEALDEVIKALKEWAKRPTAEELREARLRAQKLYEQGIDVGLPESTRDALRYHLVKLELAEAGALKPRK